MVIRLLWIIYLLLGISISVHCDDPLITNIKKHFDMQSMLDKMSTVESGSTCIEDLQTYVLSLRNETWAQMMFDASAKFPDGVMIGNLQLLGQYDECIGVEDKTIDFVGQHCMLDVKVNISSGSLKSYFEKHTAEPFAKERSVLSFKYGICLPSTCNASEIEDGMSAVFNGSILSVKADPKNCQTKEPRPLGTREKVVIVFLVAICSLAVWSTFYDVVERKIHNNDNPRPLMSSFSIFTNGKRLFTISEDAGQLKALHGIRTLSVAWVILCHSYGDLMSGPGVNRANIFKLGLNIAHIFIFNGFLSVDSFFFLSGLLVCFVFFRNIGKTGSYDAPLSYIHRYLRLTPPYAVMILLEATILAYIGDGPMWHEKIDHGATQCREHWWPGLLYLQNFIHPTSPCVGQSWYLTADMQMYWISPLILYPLFLWPAMAPFCLVICILGAAITNFSVAYVNDLAPAMVATKTIEKQMFTDYVQSYMRMSPWMLGVAVGYLICGIRANKIRIKLSAWQVACGWILSTMICLLCLFGVAFFLGPNFKRNYTTFEGVSYLAFHRVGWGVGLAWIVFACVQGYGGPINTFLSWGIFQPLGKLSYCAFLIHLWVQNFYMSQLRTAFYISDLYAVYLFFGHWVLTHLVSIPFTLLFEMPFFNIERHLFRNVSIFPYPSPKKNSTGILEKIDEEKGKYNHTFVESL